MKIKGKYLDTSTGADSKKNLLIGEKSLNKFEITTDNPEVSTVKIRETISSISSANISKSSKDTKIKLKADKYYKVLVKIPKDPGDDKTTITVTYDGKFKKEIPVTLTGVQKKLPPEEAKQVMKDLYGSIIKTYQDLGVEYNWTKMNNPPDFDILRPELLKYATPNLTDGTLKTIADDMYCQCDFIVTPGVDFDIRFDIHENSANKLVASSIQFEDLLTYNGETIYFTAIKKNGKWRLDSWDSVSPADENMNVTWKEYEKYSHNTAKLINEVMDGGRKVYIISDSSGIGIQGVYADSTEIVLDVPNEWLPPEYQQSSVSGLNGDWLIQEGKTGELSISNETGQSFDFTIHVEGGGHVGDIEGTSTIDGSTAVFQDEVGCTINFSFDGEEVSIAESYECTYWHGMAINFDGMYKKE
ncbi:hypothetical protein [Planomicrobium sp. CPCC 101110]|uniref:hypothetical protein n=1 Tax=Planomicrobium sp. CPCC 101110 TaxID=2599619 RepID=UPI0011B4ACA5|nr:hypothetical protein [Planomicrobium sp. CPCC 101110]TWT27739.1 hypothetical protein FQV30_04295 [Planomicrobium sp. CPCC 101110]